MPLLDPPTPPSAPSGLTITVNQIRELARHAYKQALNAQKTGIALVWQNSYGLTPQQVLDGLGADAAKVFQMHGLLTDFVADVQAAEGITADLALPTNAFTINQDGAVTVSTDPYTP